MKLLKEKIINNKLNMSSITNKNMVKMYNKSNKKIHYNNKKLLKSHKKFNNMINN